MKKQTTESLNQESQDETDLRKSWNRSGKWSHDLALGIPTFTCETEEEGISKGASVGVAGWIEEPEDVVSQKLRDVMWPAESIAAERSWELLTEKSPSLLATWMSLLMLTEAQLIWVLERIGHKEIKIATIGNTFRMFCCQVEDRYGLVAERRLWNQGRFFFLFLFSFSSLFFISPPHILFLSSFEAFHRP